MDKLKKQTTLVFLVVFTLIKVSPFYYRYQLFPAFQKGNLKTAVKSRYNDRQNFLIKVDKAFVDKVNLAVIPKIKFSGIPFDLFFVAVGLLLFSKNRSLFVFDCTFPHPELYLFQKSLRL